MAASIFRQLSNPHNLGKFRNLTTLASSPYAPKPFLNPYLGHLISSPTAARTPYCGNPTNGAVMLPVEGMNYPLMPFKITPEKREDDLHSAIQRNSSSVVKDFMDSMRVGMIPHQSEELLEEELSVSPADVPKELLMSDECYAAAMSSLADAVLEYNYSYFAMGISCATKKIKFAKMRKGRMGGISHRGNVISFGNYALQVLDCSWITAKQLEAGRRALSRIVGRGAKIWVRAICDKPVTERPAETRMGRGKGAVSYYVAVVQPGRILYEVSGVTESIARRGVEVAASKLPVRTRFIITDTA